MIVPQCQASVVTLLECEAVMDETTVIPIKAIVYFPQNLTAAERLVISGVPFDITDKELIEGLTLHTRSSMSKESRA